MVNPAQNEQKVLSFLVRNIAEKQNINQLAKYIGITATGAFKLLKRLEHESVVKPEKLGNAIFYSLNFTSDLARKKAELALFEEIRQPYARVQAKDLERLKPFAEAAILFGSVLEKGERAEDIDILVIVAEKKYKAFTNVLDELQRLKPKRIQAILQTFEDFVKNLKKQDPVVRGALKTGKILWGQEIVVNAVRRMFEQ